MDDKKEIRRKNENDNRQKRNKLKKGIMIRFEMMCKKFHCEN